MSLDPSLPSAAWIQNGGDVAARIGVLATARHEGALLVLEVERDSLEQTRRAGFPHEREAARLLRAWQVAADLLPPDVVGRRTLWSRCELVLGEKKDRCLALARGVMNALREDADLRQWCWQLVFTEIFAGEPERTLLCDPGYDLVAARGNVVAWVEPYPRDDWREAQRYPTVTFPLAAWAGQG